EHGRAIAPPPALRARALVLADALPRSGQERLDLLQRRRRGGLANETTQRGRILHSPNTLLDAHRHRRETSDEHFQHGILLSPPLRSRLSPSQDRVQHLWNLLIAFRPEQSLLLLLFRRAQPVIRLHRIQQ